MCSKLNAETKDGLSREVKSLQQRCLDTCNIIENSPSYINISLNDIGQKSLWYVDGVRSQIENSETSIPTDENFIISQFLAELKIKTDEVQKLTALTRGAILDVENEIKRLNAHTNMAEEAINRPKNDKRELQLEHLEKAKGSFCKLKAELHGLMQSIFRNDSDLVVNVTGELMAERLNKESNGYIPVTEENFHIVELLKDVKIITVNPYNDMEVKLAY